MNFKVIYKKAEESSRKMKQIYFTEHLPNEQYRIPLYTAHQSLHPSLPLSIMHRMRLPIVTYYNIPITKSIKEDSVDEYNTVLQQQKLIKEANYQQSSAKETKNYPYYLAHPFPRVCY